MTPSRWGGIESQSFIIRYARRRADPAVSKRTNSRATPALHLADWLSHALMETRAVPVPPSFLGRLEFQEVPI